MAKIAGELKSELQDLMKLIVDRDDIALEDTGRAMQTLRSLEGLKRKSEKGAPADDQLPYEFRRPLSGELMEDPVIIASGQTYGRIDCKNDATAQPTSNINNVGNAQRVGGSAPIITDKQALLHHLTMLASSSADDQKMSAKEIRKRTEQSQRMRSLFAELPYALPSMIKPLLTNTDVDVEEDSITALLNISVLESNKKLLADYAIPLIIKSLKSQRAVTRIRVATVLFVLSDLESSKSAIGECGAMKPLIELVYEAHVLLCENPKESCDLSVVKSTEWEKIKADVKDLQGAVSRFKQLNEQDENERDKLMEEKDVLEGEKVVLEGEKAALEGQKVVLEGEKAAVEGEKAVLEGEKAALEAQVKRLNNRMEEQRISLGNDIEKQKRNLKAEIEELSKDKDECKKSVPALKVLVVKLKKPPPRWGNPKTIKAVHLIALFLVMATFVVSILLGLKVKYDKWVAWTTNIGSVIQFFGIILSILMDVGESYDCKDLLNFGNGPSWKPRLLVVFGYSTL